jgi:hypothetical protein
MLMLVRGNAGLAALFIGDVGAARDAFCEELELSREMVILPVHEALLGLAAVAVREGHLPRAPRLFGAATAHRYGNPEDPVDARLYATFFAPARTRHGADAWDAAAGDGAALSFEDAIAHALEEEPAGAARA